MWITVSGSGTFPYDMLRYDRCVPATESDSYVMAGTEQRKVTLIMFSSLRNGGPTDDRWKSFSWKVEEARPA